MNRLLSSSIVPKVSATNGLISANVNLPSGFMSYFSINSLIYSSDGFLYPKTTCNSSK